jgi:hypothetical protein
LHFHTLNEEFKKIKACFNYFKVEIIAQNQVLYMSTNKISTDCLRLFEKIGVMDFQGMGSLIKNKKELEIQSEMAEDNASRAINSSP